MRPATVDDVPALLAFGDELRDALLESLRGVAQTLPVVVASVNPDIGDHAEQVIDLREGATL